MDVLHAVRNLRTGSGSGAIIRMDRGTFDMTCFFQHKFSIITKLLSGVIFNSMYVFRETIRWRCEICIKILYLIRHYFFNFR